MEIFEAGNLSHQNLNINWTMALNEKGDSKKNGNGNQLNVE
jgi:hypothetical protein